MTILEYYFAIGLLICSWWFWKERFTWPSIVAILFAWPVLTLMVVVQGLRDLRAEVRR